MIVDRSRRRAISSLGWIERGSLWVLDASSSPTTLRLSDARWLALFTGADDHFAVVHYFDGQRLKVTVHTMGDPANEVASWRLAPDGTQSRTGYEEAWSKVPRYYTAYLGSPLEGYYLIRLEAGVAELKHLAFFNDDSYDLVWQGVTGALEIPDTPTVLISIQRDSRLVVYDVETGTVVGRVGLGDRGGNPQPRFRTSQEIWAVDYDTLVRLNASNWAVTGQILLQMGTAESVRQFIGAFDFSADLSRCAVGRPFSGDVLLLDAEQFEVVERRKTGGQPLDVAVLADDEIIARDWNKGSLLRAQP